MAKNSLEQVFYLPPEAHDGTHNLTEAKGNAFICLNAKDSPAIAALA